MHNLLFHLIYPAVPPLRRRAQRRLITDCNTSPFRVHLRIIMNRGSSLPHSNHIWRYFFPPFISPAHVLNLQNSADWKQFGAGGPGGYYHCLQLHKGAFRAGFKLQSTTRQLHWHNCERKCIMNRCALTFSHEVSHAGTPHSPQVERFFPHT